jgi:hypothetical protein
MASKDLEAIFSYLHSQKISINKEEFQFQVETHADYPSLLAFADALSFFNIPNISARLSKKEIESLPDLFIALLKEEDKEPFLSFVQKEDFFYKYTQEKTTTKVSSKEFQNLWQDIVLLVEKPEGFRVREGKYFSLKSILFIGFAFGVLGMVYYFSPSLLSLVFGIISIIGIFFSLEALKTELGIESKVSQSFCNAIPNADCSQIINSEKNTWLKNFKISDISIWLFSSQLFSLLLFSIFGAVEYYFSYLIFALVLSIPMTIFSIYFQYKVEKKWCPICLIIIGLVYTQLIILLINYKQFFGSYNFKTTLLFTFGFAFCALAVYLLKSLLIDNKNSKEENIKNLRFKKNYNVFKNNLQKEEQQFFSHENIILGNPNAKLKISIVTSPFCSYCKEAHEVLHKILLKSKENLSVSIRFNYDTKFDEKNEDLYFRLVEINEEKGSLEFSEALQFWFENKNIEQWVSKYGKPNSKFQIQEKLQILGDENKNKELNFTPNIFINQYKFPGFYDKKDLEFFIADLIEDEEL